MSRSTHYAPTYSSVRNGLWSNAQNITRQSDSVTCPHDLAQADRVRELFLMGIRLCGEKMGTPKQIEDLVDRRFREIQEEMSPLNPDPFKKLEEQATVPSLSKKEAVRDRSRTASSSPLPTLNQHEDIDSWTDYSGSSSSEMDLDSPSAKPARRARKKKSASARQSPPTTLHASPPRPKSPASYQSPFSTSMSSSSSDMDSYSPSTALTQRARKRKATPARPPRSSARLPRSSRTQGSPPQTLPSTPPNRSPILYQPHSSVPTRLDPVTPRLQASPLPLPSTPPNRSSVIHQPPSSKTISPDSIPRHPLRDTTAQKPRSKQSHALIEAWDDIESELEHALDLYLNTYSGADHSLAYHETISCIENAIAAAQKRPNDLEPDKLWDETVQAIQGFHEADERRREFLEPMDVDELAGPADEDDDGDLVEAPGKRSINMAVPCTYDWRLYDSYGEREPNPFESSASTAYRPFTHAAPRAFTPPKSGSFASQQPPSAKPTQEYTFPRITYNGAPMREKDDITRRFYREVVMSTLNALGNSTESRQVENLVYAYADWVDEEIPETEIKE